MQRAAGYLFFVALAVMGVVSLADRFGRAGALGHAPDWLAVGLIGAALVCGVWLLCGRKER